MRHLLQNLSTGKTTIIDAPDPAVGRHSVLAHSVCSLISAGTERMLVDFGKANLLSKARQQPEKVKMVLEKIQSDGLVPTIEAVRTKLDQPISLGYSNVGVVSEVGPNVSKLKIGDRIVSNGPHSSIVSTTETLSARIPDSVDDASASFTVVGSIALQGVRLSAPTLGESFVVIGAGLIGLLTIQFLKAHGCRVLAVDIDDEKLALAKKFGAEICNSDTNPDLVSEGLTFSKSVGVDGVIITASTKSNDPVAHAARMSRKRGRIILVGVTGLELNRADFYEKELVFQVSCSYGPGRYDSEYEEKAQDYPVGYVRWTQQRNFEAVLDLMAEGKLDVKPLLTQKFAFEDAEAAYSALSHDKSVLGILLEYPSRQDTDNTKKVRLQTERGTVPSNTVVGFIGAGNYASRVLIPSFKSAGVRLHTLATEGGVSGAVAGESAGFEFAVTDVSGVMSNEEINTLVIATRHDSHADLIIEGLQSSKNIFVEKPVCLTLAELERIETAYSNSSGILMVGFNRRFAPLVRKMHDLLRGDTGPIAIGVTVNAGAVPADHWVQDRTIGGGRLIGEACHFVDLLKFLVGCSIESFDIVKMSIESEDTMNINLKFVNGSIGTISYFANGSKKYPKERLEVFAAGRILQLDNYRVLRGFDWPGIRKIKSYTQDKGQDACVSEFVTAVEKGVASPISIADIFEVSQVCIELDGK